MKAILVLDEMPESCMKCPLRFKDGDTDDWFRFRCIKNTDQIPKEGRLWNCELKPLPQRKEELYYPCNEYMQAVNEGFNKCIDELLGEE